MAYNFNKDVSTENFTIQVDTAAHYGYFEHKRHGDGCGGGLWFDDIYAKTDSLVLEKKLMLTDYDGVFELPTEVATSLRGNGFIVGEEFD